MIDMDKNFTINENTHLTTASGTISYGEFGIVKQLEVEPAYSIPNEQNIISNTMSEINMHMKHLKRQIRVNKEKHGRRK